MSAARPDAVVVAAYGKILPMQVLEIPPKGSYNIHASLLPELRGAAPINWAIINGLHVTGVTIMKMDEGLDTGDMLLKEEMPINPEDTSGTLGDKLSVIGARMIVKALADLEAGRLVPLRQEHEKATYAPMLKKETGLIDWSRPAVEIERQIRGLDPWPGAYAMFGGKTVRVWKAEVGGAAPEPGGGVIIGAGKEGIAVATADGTLLITELQLEGGRRMSARDYLAGHKVSKGERFTAR
ncbi:MAG: methionyl-tRNA formyltransferase [Nitrospirota bacterium]